MYSKKKVRGSITAICLLLALMNTGCETVEPWEKVMLSDYTMNPERDPLNDIMREHIYFSREASAGGAGVGGGGCGCN